MPCHIFPTKRPTLGMFESKFYAFKGKIDIDPNFWSKWRSYLPSEVYFTDPVGNSFPIGISSKGDSAVFKRNVNTMVRFYGLNRKHSVLFCYKGGNQFYILVGNRYGVEIKYPQKPSDVVEISSNDSESDHEGHVDSVDDGSDPEDFPFWTMTMSKSSASGRNVLPIPVKFVREGLLQNQRVLTLRLDNGDQILCKILKGSRRRNERYLSRGWYKFCRDQKFKEGDMLLFYSKGDPYNLCIMIKRS